MDIARAAIESGAFHTLKRIAYPALSFGLLAANPAAAGFGAAVHECRFASQAHPRVCIPLTWLVQLATGCGALAEILIRQPSVEAQRLERAPL